MGTQGIVIILAASVVALWIRWRQNPSSKLDLDEGIPRVNGWRGYGRLAFGSLPWIILIFGAWVVAGQAAAEALEFRIGSVPGMGNWAFKTKLLMMTGDWPADFFEYEAHNRRMGYPPGFPLLCGWCAAFMGGLETHAIRLLPVLLTVGTFLLAGGEMIRKRGWWGLPGIAALFALLLGYPGRGILSHFYAEPLLLYMSAVAVVALGRVSERSGGFIVVLLAAGSMAWVKNEGVVVFFLIAGAMFLFAGRAGVTRRSIAMATLCVGIPAVLAWRVYLATHGWSDEAFSREMLFEERRWEKLAGAWDEYRKAMFREGARLGGAWWILPILGWFGFQRRSGFLPVLLVTSVGLVAVAVVMMMGSAEKDFEWHIAAASRVLLCPEFYA